MRLISVDSCRRFARDLPRLGRFIRDDRRLLRRLAEQGAARGPAVADGARNEIQLVCFSYRHDLGVLETSLRSLRASGAAAKVRFVLVSDRKAPYRESDVAAFEALIGQPVRHLRTPHDHGQAGVYSFLNELTVFHRLAREAGPSAFLVKVDSDVLYLDDAFFEFLATDLVHDYVFQDVRTTFEAPRWPSYAQGGCYAFRPPVILRASGAAATGAVGRALGAFLARGRVWAYWKLCEDILMYVHLYPFAARPLSTRFFVYCPYRPRLARYEPPRFMSLMHFERCSSRMRDHYESLVGRGIGSPGPVPASVAWHGRGREPE